MPSTHSFLWPVPNIFSFFNSELNWWFDIYRITKKSHKFTCNWATMWIILIRFSVVSFKHREWLPSKVLEQECLPEEILSFCQFILWWSVCFINNFFRVLKSASVALNFLQLIHPSLWFIDLIMVVKFIGIIRDNVWMTSEVLFMFTISLICF